MINNESAQYNPQTGFRPAKVESFPDCEENPLWLDNSIQFPRLISELMAAGVFDSDTMDGLSVDMDLDEDEVNQIIDRAQEVWADILEQQRETDRLAEQVIETCDRIRAKQRQELEGK